MPEGASLAAVGAGAHGRNVQNRAGRVGRMGAHDLRESRGELYARRVCVDPRGWVREPSGCIGRLCLNIRIGGG